MCKELLQQALIEKKLPNTLLLCGSGGKETALWLASELLQTDRPATHPDFCSIMPEGKGGLHAIEAIRKGISFSQVMPFAAPVKIVLIESAERMQPAAANALLKTLEEPVGYSYWILISDKPQEILPTVLSRCSKFGSSPPTTTSDAGAKEAITLLLSLVNNRPSYPQLSIALERIDKLMEDKEAMPLLIALAQLRDREDHWQEALEQAKLGLERNIKLATCLEYLFLK